MLLVVGNGGKEVGGIYSSGQWTGGFLVVGGSSGARIVDAAMAET
jgi:hypothetical protein